MLKRIFFDCFREQLGRSFFRVFSRRGRRMQRVREVARYRLSLHDFSYSFTARNGILIGITRRHGDFSIWRSEINSKNCSEKIVCSRFSYIYRERFEGKGDRFRRLLFDFLYYSLSIKYSNRRSSLAKGSIQEIHYSYYPFS